VSPPGRGPTSGQDPEAGPKKRVGDVAVTTEDSAKSAHAGAVRLAKIADRLERRGMVKPARAVRLIAGNLIDEHLEWFAEAHVVGTAFCPVDGDLMLHAFDVNGDMTTVLTMAYGRWSTLGDAA
jgi:hypothetical protein